MISVTTFQAEKAILHFDSNDGELTANPMVGHSEGPDIHPYSLSLIPLIAV